MKQNYRKTHFVSAFMSCVLLALPLAVSAQSNIRPPKNKYKVQDDVRIGREAAAKVDRQFPILNDRQATSYVASVGERLTAAIPPAFQQPAFDYRFKVVNASDINAFALPGGPMYVNRGMIEAAKNEGEMAGVMAHEISHVALRHATAQQTKLNNPLNQILGIGAILGGAVVGGETGAQLGQIFAAGYFLRYSREYESQADILGARIMADAGYDPRDLANIFRTIQQQSSNGGRTPEWLSSHPDPGNRYQNINREAQALRVSADPIKVTREFSRTRERLRALPPARSMAQIEQGGPAGNTGQSQRTTTGGRYTRSVAAPSARYRNYTGAGQFSVRVPSNWREFTGTSDVTFAPDGAFGEEGITHGAMIGIAGSSTGRLDGDSQAYVNQLLQGNDYLRQRGGLIRTTVGGRAAYTAQLYGRSPITGGNEVVTIYTSQLRSGDLFYIATVSPEELSASYAGVFRMMIGSLRFND